MSRSPVARFLTPLLAAGLALGMAAQAEVPAQTPAQNAAPSHSDLLRGAYGPYRANNDLLSYRLDVRVDPANKFLSGKNTIRFRMLADGDRIQIDLHDALQVDKILMVEGENPGTPLRYTRDSGAVLIDFPQTLHAGNIYAIDFYYSGHPVSEGRFGGITFLKDPSGHPWINTSCEDVGASVWWPNKDQWRDEVEEMEIHVAIPNGLVDVSNGRFEGKTDLGDGYTRWDWHVHYPINNYDVALNIGNYVHFGEIHNGLAMDYYVLPENLIKAKEQFAQATQMIDIFEHYFGEYPFIKDGYKLVETPYLGMEHQSAVAYGNKYLNGYAGRDWTGVGISPRFDFIIIHESGHEWFGNAVSAADRSDMWIHEGWTTYLEYLYVESRWGRADSLRYMNAEKSKIENKRPILTGRGVNGDPPEDQYFKGALLLNTLRSVIDNDNQWFQLIRGFYQTFKYKNILTEDVVAYFNQQTGKDLTPIFNQYLRHKDIPTLELQFDPQAGTVAYRWQTDERDFSMPVLVGAPDHWQILTPTTSWQTMSSKLDINQLAVATDLYYINVSKR